MTTQLKIYIGMGIAVLAITLGVLMSSTWSTYKIGQLETDVQTAKAAAAVSEKSASQKEMEAAEYKQKISYLESQLAEIRTIASKQDEQLKTLNSNTDRARGDVRDARRVRSIAATADELCKKLAELGHGCE